MPVGLPLTTGGVLYGAHVAASSSTQDLSQIIPVSVAFVSL